MSSPESVSVIARAVPPSRQLLWVGRVLSALFAILGAVLLTGLLGGAIASQLRVESPLFSHILFGAYLGTFMWVGLYLRDPRMRNLI